MTVLNENTILISQTEGSDPTQPVVTALIENASKEVMDFAENRFNEILQRSRLIPKEKIREVFTQIDNKFAGN